MRALKYAIIIGIAALLVGCEYLLPPSDQPLAHQPSMRPVQGLRSVTTHPSESHHIMATQRQMSQIIKKVTAVRSVWDNGTLKLKDLSTGPMTQTDPWGHEYRLKSIQHQPNQSAPPMAGFILVSAGPDGWYNNADDIRWQGDLLPLEESN